MSTNDVPGHNKVNNDELSRKCWAESADGSIIEVWGIDNGVTWFHIYDPTNAEFHYRTGMPTDEFKKQFSWDPKKTGPLAVKWTWHDKTDFPVRRVIEMGIKEGFHKTFAADVMSTAEMVAKTLKAQKIPTDQQALRMRHSHEVEKVTPDLPTWKAIFGSIFQKVSTFRSPDPRG